MNKDEEHEALFMNKICNNENEYQYKWERLRKGQGYYVFDKGWHTH